MACVAINEEYNLFNVTDKFLINELRLINQKLKEYFKNKSHIESIKKFTKCVIRNYWLEFIENSSKRDQKELIEKIVDFLPKKLLDIFNQYVSIIEYDSYNFTDHKNFKETFKLMCSTKWPNSKIADVMIKLNFDSNIKEVVDTIYKDVDKSSVTNSLLFGRTGCGKTTLACITEGYFCTLNNNVPGERIISDNGRGTDDFEKISMKISNAVLNLYDFTGFSDPGKGFENTIIFNSLIDKLKNESNSNKINLDTILYTLDLSVPRLDKSDYDLLNLFMTQMSKIYDGLDYWNNVILVCTKANLVKIKQYEKFGGLPEYELSNFRQKNKLPLNQETINKYNNIYKYKLYQAMEQWYQEIKRRIFCKLFDGRICQDDNGQSFNIYFKKIAKSIYPDMTDSYLDDIVKNISYVIVGEADKDEESNKWDYRNCKIKAIPNFDDSLNEFFEDDDYEFQKKIIPMNLTGLILFKIKLISYQNLILSN